METKNNIKYTTDGKKVVVIGELNQSEKIVQEIYVTDNGDEIPSGDRFVAKNLLDQPMKTWQQRELEQWNFRYDSERKQWEDKLEKLRIAKRIAYQSLESRVKWLRAVSKQPHPKALTDVVSTLADFLSDEDKWVVSCYYNRWYVERFDKDGLDKLEKIDGDSVLGRNFRYLRLLSLYGDSEGNLQWRINAYADGSGSDKDVAFFRKKESALEFLQKKLDKRESYCGELIDTAKRLGLVLDENKIQKYKYERQESIKKHIDNLKGQIDSENKRLEEIKLI